MTLASLEKRLAALEKTVATLLAARSQGELRKDWRRTRGRFTGDTLIKQVFAEGAKIRDAERKRLKPRMTKTKQPGA